MKPVIRGMGPSLSTFGVTNALQDPTLELHDATGTIIATNNNWADTQQSAITATGHRPSDPRESAIALTLPPGVYTAIERSADNLTAGVGLVEVYAIDETSNSKLSNISTRGFVGTGENVTIAGFILGGGNGSGKVLVRALGPTLTNFGVSGAIGDPTIEIYDSNGMLLASNDDWKDYQEPEITAARQGATG